MNILIFNFEYPPLGGGGAAATQQLATHLARKHSVHVVTTHFGDLPSVEEEAGVHVYRVRVWGRRELPTSTLSSLITYAPAALWRGLSLMRKHQIDVINAQFVVPSGVPALILSWLFKRPLVVSFIGGDVFDPTKGTSPHRHGILRWLIRFIGNRATRATAISEDTKQRAQEIHGVTTDIAVIHLGVADIPPSTATRQQLSLPNDAPVFVSIGRLVPRKGYMALLTAWARIPEAELIIIGDGPLRAQLTQQIRDKQLEGRVHVVGHVSEQKKHDYLQVADGYVSATEHEGFGIVYLEAMAHGLPIVSTDVGGHIDFLKRDESAILVAVGNEAGLAAGVERLIAEPQFAEKMGERNKADVAAFSLEATSQQFERILDEARHAHSD